MVAQSDFTHMSDLGVTLGGVPFPHLLFHLVLTYSNVEAVRICFSESFEALVEGLEAACGSSAACPAPASHRPPERGDPAAGCRRPGPGARALRAR